MRSIRLAMAQMNPTVGDIDGNTRAITAWVSKARKAKADVIVFPELAITGYPPEDLVFRPRFLQENRKALGRLIPRCRGIVGVFGFIDEETVSIPPVGHSRIVPAGPHRIFNAAAIVANQQWLSTYRKMILPNYGVFDESRYFHPGSGPVICQVNGVVMSVTICEDIWHSGGPAHIAAREGGAELIVNINASPFHMGKTQTREQMLAGRVQEIDAYVSYINMVGGQDELIFDGSSLVMDREGNVMARAKAFDEELLIIDLNFSTRTQRKTPQRSLKRRSPRDGLERVSISTQSSSARVAPPVPSCPAPLDPLEEVYQALVLGVRDYVRKNNFSQVVVGVSGGIDSALTLMIATDALGAAGVLGVFMPSPFTSQESRIDARKLAANLHVPLLTIPITKIFSGYVALLAPAFQGLKPDATEENLQARIRGNIVMALSNKFGHLVLTTGNKSEMSVGYATLYGDMAGGFAVLKDVFKTLVYDLARWRNQQSLAQFPHGIIPTRIIEREPSAELKANQKDQDTLPPYHVLDAILKVYVEEEGSTEDLVAMGFSRRVVTRVLTMVDRSEYKRRQAPLGIKITHRALGKDRRLPVTNGFRIQ